MKKTIAVFVVVCLVILVVYPTSVLLGFNPIGLNANDLDNSAVALFFVMWAATSIGEILWPKTKNGN